MTKNIDRQRKALKTGLIALLAFVLVFSTGSLIFINHLYLENFPHYDRPKYSGYLQFNSVPPLAYSTVHFPSGKNSLTGYIFDEGTTKGLVVIAPGRGQGAERYLAETLYFVDQGWSVFSFDYTGCFTSEGENSVGLPQSRVDLEAALAYIRSNTTLNKLPVVLWGHSWGGYAVTAVLKGHPDISAVVSISGFNSPKGLMDEYVRDQVGILGYIMYPFEWMYQTARFGQSAQIMAVNSINSSDTPVMIVHDADDEAISYDGASIIVQRSRITNPNAVYITRHTINGSGHMDLLRSEAALQYIHQKNREFKPIFDHYQGNIPDSVKAEFYAGVDPFRTSELDADFMNEINSFFESALRASQ